MLTAFELWMGTHPTSPSHIYLDASTIKPLAKHLEDQPHLMGGNVIRQFSIKNGNLPFLFKVLSIRKPLSIQTHPDKPMAEKLHVERPDIYKGAFINSISPARKEAIDLIAY